MIFGYWFSQLASFTETDFLLQLRPTLWHLDALCVRDKNNVERKGGAFALSGKGVNVHIFSTGIFEHHFIQTRVTHVFGGTDIVGRGTEIACVVGGQEVGIAKECEFFSYAFATDEEFISSVDAFLIYQQTHTKKPTLVLIDLDRTPSFQDKNVALIDDPIELAIKKITDLDIIVLVPAGDGYRKDGELLGVLNVNINSPARMKSVFSVGAFDYDYSPAIFSNYGKDVSVIAPGCGIVTGSLNDQKTANSGTHLAMACVAGIAVQFLQKNPEFGRLDFEFFIKNHFFTTGLTIYLDYYLDNDPVYVPDNETDTFTKFWYNKLPYYYWFPIIDSYRLAHCPYLRSKLILNNSFLGEVLANTSFSLQIDVESKTPYNEYKPLHFKIIGNTPDWLFLEIGETTGKVFGSSGNVTVSTPCVFYVLIEDGVYAITKMLTFNVLPNFKKLSGFGAKLKALVENDLVLNLEQIKRSEILLNIEESNSATVSVVLPLQRKIYLLDRITGSFVAKTKTSDSGEFIFYTSSGLFQAVAIDESFSYNATVLDYLRTS